MINRWLALFAAALLIVGAAACAPNPADDVPAAQVTADDETADDETADDETADDETADDEMADDETADDEMAEDDMADDEMADDMGGAIALTEGTVGFTGSKVTRSHNCFFEVYDASLDPGEGTAETAQLTVTIDTTTIYCDPDESGEMHERFNGHIRSDDFLDVEVFPTASFVSTSIVEGSEAGGTHTITGDLTLKDITQEITFPATIEITDDRVSGQAEFAVNRQDWNIVYPGAPDDLIRDEVVLQIDLQGQR